MSKMYEIKPAYKYDWVQLLELWEQSVRATHHFLHPSDIIYYKRMIYNQYFETYKLFYANNPAGEKAGFIGVHNNMLEMLFIRPDLRGKGYGRVLTEYALSTLEINLVDVNEENKQALGFYEKLGFRVVGRSSVDSENKVYPIFHMRYTKK